MTPEEREQTIAALEAARGVLNAAGRSNRQQRRAAEQARKRRLRRADRERRRGDEDS